MKKIVISFLALSFLMAVTTGCAKGTDSSQSSEETVSSQTTQITSSEDEYDPEKELVSGFFNDYKGYWLNKDGEYVIFRTEENGDACLDKFTGKDTKAFSQKAVSIYATNKTTYVAVFEDGTKLAFEIADSYDKVIGIHPVDSDANVKYVFAGHSDAEMKENYSSALNRAAS